MSQLSSKKDGARGQVLPVVVLRDEDDGLPRRGVAWQTLDNDMYSQALPFSLQWALLWRKHDLLFSVRWPLDVQGVEAQKGSFVEGLWEGDCAELFLCHPQGHEYWELNLSPQGAWWWCAFSAPRVRSKPDLQALSGVRASWYATKDFQVSALSIPRLHLQRWLESAPSTQQLAWRGNVSACLGQPQQFASVAKLSAKEPDFHRPEEFLPLQMS